MLQRDSSAQGFMLSYTFKTQSVYYMDHVELRFYFTLSCRTALTLCSMLVCALLKYHSKHTYPLKDRTHGLIPYHFDRESKSCFVCILSRPVVSTCGHSCSVIYSQCRTVSLGVSDPNLLWPFYFSEFDYHSMSPRASSSILAMTLLAILQYDTKRLLENWSKQDTTSATQTVTRCPCGRFGSW